MSVEVEIAWFHPCFHTIATDADGYVALEYHLALHGMLMHAAHLLVEIELHEIPECHLFICCGATIAHVCYLFGCEMMMVGPLTEGGGAVEVAEMAEGAIGHKPMAVALEEGLEGCLAHGLRSRLGI